MAYLATKFRKQLSLETSSVSAQSKEVATDVGAEGDEVGYKRQPQQQRSLSLSGVGVKELRGHSTKHSQEITSPLRKFSRAKETITQVFDILQQHLLETQEHTSQVQKGVESEPLAALIKRTTGITALLQRDHMKVVFFGRTSNGKSTVINSLLRERVLPAGIGHTTSCFCSVMGVDHSEGYLISPDSKERQNVKNVRQMAHSLHKKRLDSNSLVQIFWPRTKCPLLSGEVELVDSPGIDMNPDLDQWISKYCLGADVFVLVSNAESALMTVEKNFFHRVSKRLSKPNIFILNNRWDCSAQEEPDMMEEVKKQHLSADMDFLSRELAVVDEATARDRVFFVSAKEVLHVRTHQQQQQPGAVEEEEGSGLADRWKERLMEFERFEDLFKHCISSSAILTKFEQHYKQGSEVVKELEQLLEQELSELDRNNVTMKGKQVTALARREFLRRESEAIQVLCEDKIRATTGEVEKRLASAIKNTVSLLPQFIKDFKGVFDKGPETLPTYLQKLYEFIDQEFSQSVLDHVTASSLATFHEEAKNDIIASYQSHLKLELGDSKNLLCQQIVLPQLSFPLECSHFCQDFTPHTEFHFLHSLGISSSQLNKTFNLGPVIAGMSSHVLGAFSWLPAEYVVPMTILGGALLLPRVFSLRVGLVSIAVYGGLYTWKWSHYEPEKSVKEQLVNHLHPKLKTLSRAICQNFKTQMEGGLGIVLNTLNGEREKESEVVEKSISECTIELSSLGTFQEKARSLKNNAHFTRSMFEEFKENYLQTEKQIT